MTIKMMLLVALPGIALTLYHVFKRRSSVGIVFLLTTAVMLILSYGVGSNAGCEQPFCIDWNSGIGQVDRR